MLSGAVFTALADATRRQIFELVAASPRSVADLAARVTVSRPAVSQHLKVLKEVGLIRGEIDGPRTCYCLEPRTLRRLKALVGGL